MQNKFCVFNFVHHNFGLMPCTCVYQNPKHLKILQIPKMCKLKSRFVYMYKYLISVEHKTCNSKGV